MSSARHRWEYPVDPYIARYRTCKRCGTTGRTYGVGAGRIWDYQTADGKRTTGKVPPCEPVPGLPDGWRVEVHRNPRAGRAPRYGYTLTAPGGPEFVSPFRYHSEDSARQAGIDDAARCARTGEES